MGEDRTSERCRQRGARRLVAVAAVLIAALACRPETVTPADVEGPFVWGALDNVTRLRDLWFAGQPDAAALERARAEGVAVVIDLRDPSERAWDERAAVESLGMTYHNVPVRGGRPFDAASFQQIEALVAGHAGTQILIHCSSSNRAGGWLATHVAGEFGLSVDDALAVGRRAGITKEPIERAVRAYLGAAPPAAGGGPPAAELAEPTFCRALVELEALDPRDPVPLRPVMAWHQKRNMQEHLVAIQRIADGLAAEDWAAISRAAALIGSSPEMEQQCRHMGAGADGFTERALDFHRRADAIGAAADARDPGAVLRGLSSTLAVCTGCHAVFRQQVVDADTWTERTGQAHAPMQHGH